MASGRNWFLNLKQVVTRIDKYDDTSSLDSLHSIEDHLELFDESKSVMSESMFMDFGKEEKSERIVYICKVVLPMENKTADGQDSWINCTDCMQSSGTNQIGPCIHHCTIIHLD